MRNNAVYQDKRYALAGDRAARSSHRTSEAQFYRVLRVVGLVFFTLLVLFPLYTIVTTAIKPLQDVQSVFRWPPSQIAFAPFSDIWQTVPLAQYFLNSIVISGLATIVSVIIAILAYYGFAKAGYFYTKRVYAPVLASFKAQNNGSIELWVTNDTLNEVTDTLMVRAGTFTNGTVWKESCQIRVAPNSSQIVQYYSADKVMAGAGSDSYLSVRSANGLCPTNRLFFSAIKELQRSPVQPEVSITQRGEHELHIHLHAATYTFFVHFEVPDERTYFADNYFDLEAGENRGITITNQFVTLSPEMISIGWR